MNKYWAILLLILTSAVFFKLGPHLPLQYAIPQSLGYSVLTFIGVYALLLFIQGVTGRDFGLVVPKS